jgi:hypothetical protein
MCITSLLRACILCATLAGLTGPARADGLRFPNYKGETSADLPGGGTGIFDEAPYLKGEYLLCMGSAKRTPVRVGPTPTSRQIWILPRERYAACFLGVDQGWGVFAAIRSPHIGTINGFVRDYKGHYGWVDMKDVGYDPDDCEDYRTRRDDGGYEYPSPGDVQRRDIGHELFCLKHLGNVRGNRVIVIHYGKQVDGVGYKQRSPISLRGCNAMCLEESQCGGISYNISASACELRASISLIDLGPVHGLGFRDSDNFITGVKLVE